MQHKCTPNAGAISGFKEWRICKASASCLWLDVRSIYWWLYKAVLEHMIKDVLVTQLSNVIMDFECAARSAVHTVLPQVTCSGCHFHWTWIYSNVRVAPKVLVSVPEKCPNKEWLWRMAQKAKSQNTQTQSTLLPANSRSAQRSRAGRHTSTVPGRRQVAAYPAQKTRINRPRKDIEIMG